MTARKKALLAASVLLLLSLAGVLIWLLAAPDPDARNSQTVPLYSFADRPTSVSVQTDTTAFTMNAGREGWTIDTLQGIPLNQSVCDALAAGVKTLSASRLFAPQQPLSDYGLDSPVCALRGTFENDSLELLIGDENPEKSGRYCTADGGQTVGLVPTSAVSPMLRTDKNYILLSPIPYSARQTDETGNWIAGGVTACTLSRPDLPQTLSFSAGQNGELRCTTDGWQAGSDLCNQLANACFSLSAESVAAIYPTDTQLQQFGLSSPAAVAAYTIDGEDKTLLIGGVASSTQYEHTEPGTTDEETPDTVSKRYYFQMQGVPVVYTASEENLPWLTMSFTRSE